VSGLANIAVLGIIVGGLLAWKGPGFTRRLGWQVAIGGFLLLLALQFVAQGANWASQNSRSIVIVVGVGLVVAVAAVVVWRSRTGVVSSARSNSSRNQTSNLGESVKVADSVVPSFQPFVGKSANGRLITVSPEDTIGVIGPPRSGKTAGILIPQALMWAGPMISVSVREDVLMAVGDQRERIAQPHGGHVYIFDPAESSRVELRKLNGGNAASLPLIRWSPLAGCRKAEVAKLRAEAMVWASLPTDSGAARHPHFERLASMILRDMFHAAALHDRPLQDVLMWIDAKNFIDPADLLRKSESPERMIWTNELLGLGQLAPEERGSAFSTAGNALDAFKLSTVLRNCSTSDIDVRTFVKQHSTLFVIAGIGMQRALAPLFSAMLESVAFEIIDELAREDGGKLDPRLLVQLDEIANIAPLPNLLTLLTVCGGSGVCLSYASQNWQQVATRYGQDQMKSIWQSTKAQIVFGGVGDRDMLEDLSQLMGVKKEKTKTRTREAFKPLASSSTTGEQEVAKLRVDEIFNPDGSAHLFYRNAYQRIEPALYFDKKAGAPFGNAVGWTPSGIPLPERADLERAR
jgi:type IV secretion system protein VirD4